jgi:hypothetical protein
MSLLNPWFLLATVTVAVPVFLHLFQRRKSVRLSFPALRYLERMEREHAHEIRFRQLLLLVLRIAALILLVLAAARPLIPGPGSAHRPTAVALVLDNSMSSGLVDGDLRVLDRLKAVAGMTLDAAGPEDRFWIVRAGAPWEPATPASREEAHAIVDATEVTAARGDLTAALRRASELVGTSELPAREIHLVSDLQASAFDPSAPSPAGEIPVLVWRPEGADADNRALVELLVGSGLAPVLGQPAELNVRISESSESSSPVGVRALMGGRIRGATSVPPGAVATLPLPTSEPEWVVGSVEADPDRLSLDDRRYFAFRVRSPPNVEVVGSPGRFVEDALAVLNEANRIGMASGTMASAVRIAVSGAGLQNAPPAGAVVVVPPADLTRLPALNVRLQSAGVPWRYEPPTTSGTATIEGEGLPPGLDGVDVRSWMMLDRSGESVVPSRIVAEVAGDPWAVETATAEGVPVLLLASPLDASSTSLPVSAGLVRFLAWVAGGWNDPGGTGLEHVAGEPLPVPAGVTHVVDPTGDTTRIDGTRAVASTGTVGLYRFLAGDSTVAWAAVNTQASESDLARMPEEGLHQAVGENLAVASNPDAWRESIFVERTGPEIWWPLILLAGLILLAESRIAAAGHRPAAPSIRSEPAQAHGDS